MLTLLIVDDEYLVRKGIRETIDWESFGYRVIGEAGNGREGLDLARAHRPDIIITDIRMPFVDGLEFMANLREAGLESRIIVLSGYGEFDYARAAMNNGAVAYLLKPIENNQLIDTVSKVGETIVKDRHTIEYYNQLQNELPTIKKQFLLDLIHGDIPSLEDINAKLALLELPLAISGSILALVAKIDDYKITAQQLPPQTLEQLRKEILLQLNQTFMADPQGFRSVILEKNPGEWVLILQVDQTHTRNADLVGWVKESCKELFARLKHIPDFETAKVTWSVGISNQHPTITEITSAYQEADLAVAQKFLPGGNSVVAFADDGAADCRAEIKKAIAYIRSNYAQNITVETAAKELFISPSHLMHLFKAELGKTFNDSLIDYRIEMAKELMKNPLCRVYEVCQQVGYNDTKYFSQLFKKITGMSPKDYVKKAL